MAWVNTSKGSEGVMRRWILGGVLALSVLTSGCVYRANYYRHGSDYRYRGGYDYGYQIGRAHV